MAGARTEAGFLISECFCWYLAPQWEANLQVTDVFGSPRELETPVVLTSLPATVVQELTLIFKKPVGSPWTGCAWAVHSPAASS